MRFWLFISAIEVLFLNFPLTECHVMAAKADASADVNLMKPNKSTNTLD